ncbi:putative tape measure protein [Escherichia phage JLBYU43]|uniref:Tape measure protein n=1 Tax=Escherichia phage JLBYU43 TaxID=2894751 RepID=A0AAE8YXV6_9CAUD|nr:putative tape measure protein [Escherichia phage JLBYU43]
MTDKLIRELLIDVKQKGATRTAKSIENVSDALENAAAASELTNEQLGKMPKTLYSIERAADRAAKSLTKMQASRGMLSVTKSINDIGAKLDDLAITMIEVADKLEVGFNGVSRSVKAMGNDVAAATEKVYDRLYDTNRVLGGTAKGFNNTAGAASRASRAIGNTSGSARGATRDFAAMAKVGGGLPILYAAFASNIFVLQSALDNLKVGDQLNRLEQFGTIVGSMTGTPVQTLALALQNATNGAVSFEEAMRQASTASAYGFDSEQLEQFGLVARRAAAVLGVDMTDALNRVIKGVSKQEIELLDELGVTIRLNDAYANYVKQLNATSTGIKYTVDSLTTYQRQQAYANEVIAESTRRFGYLDDALRATSWEQFATNANSALRSLQQSAATYLTPVIDTINTFLYQTKSSQMRVSAMARSASAKTTPTENVTALIENAVGAQEDLDTYLKESDARIKKAQEIKQQLDDLKAKQAATAPFANALTAFGIGGDESNKLVVQLTNELARQNQEIEERAQTEKILKQAVQDTGEALLRNGNLAKQLGANMKYAATAIPGETGVFEVDPKNLKAVAEIQKNYDQLKKSSSDTANNIKMAAGNITNAKKAAGDLASSIKAVEDTAKVTGQSTDTLVKNLNLGFQNLDQMKTTQKGLAEYAAAMDKTEQNALEVAKRKDEVYAQTKDKAKAEAAAREVLLRQQQEQLTAAKALLAINPNDPEALKQVAKIETEILNTKAQGFENAKKVKDQTDKILGVDREIALLNNRTMTDTQYRLAQLNLELQLEREKTELYSKQENGQAKMEQSRRAQAQIEREIWKFRQDQIASMAAGREEEQQRQFTAKPLMGNAERLQEQLKLYEDLKQKTLGNAAAQAEYNKKIAETRAQLAGLRAQRNAEMQASVGSSLGAVYTPTTGLSGEDKDFADMGNRMASYDQAISKLSELNSEATAVAQSIGNLTNAMIQFSMGSLDTTSTIAAGMQTVASMIQYSTSQQVSAIDQAIAAEQKRDGKSEASKAKLKKLEAEKLKIQQDAAKKQIIIQTAVAVMQAATAVPYPFSIPLMVAAGLAGALALAQASSASSMSSIADSGADTTSYLTLGERQKNIDVSMSANAGELSYIRGDKGIGGANSFVPRAEGGNMYPGVSYQMGEHGTEVVTPMVPMKATPNDELKTSSNSTSGRPIILNISAMDAASFREFASSNSGALRDAVELALNENGASLKTLGNS